MAAVHETVFCSLGCKNVTAMSPTGSETTTNTTGIVVVASWAARATATKMSTLALTSSAASALKRSYCSAAKRFSRTKFLPST